MTRKWFTDALTRSVGAEVTLHTRRAWAAQCASETPRSGGAKFNPLNTTLRMPGSTDFNTLPNGIAVQNYVSAEQGLEAAIRTFKEHGFGYGPIRRALRANADATDIVTAMGNSSWGTELALVLAVLDDIKHDRKPNRLDELEALELAS